MKLSKIILIFLSLLIAGTAELKADDLYLRPVKSDYNLTPGSTFDVQYRVDLPKGATSLQFTVRLPEEFELVAEGLFVNDANLQSRIHWDGENEDYDYPFLTYNLYNCVLYSADNSPIDTSGDYLFALRLKARETSSLGPKPISIFDVYAADASGSETRIYGMTTDVRIVDSIPAESIVLSQTEAYLKVGESIKLIATVFPEEATDKTVAWNSSNESVATVDARGNVTALSVGEAVITANCGDISATCIVTVEPAFIPAESIVLSQTEAYLKVGESIKLIATVLPEEATDKTVTWSSSNEAYVTVDATGTVTVVAYGSAMYAVITATCGDVSASCLVYVAHTPAESIVLNQTTAKLKVGETASLTATVLPEDATDKTVTWTSSNEAVATVDASGNVMALSAGEAVVTATCGEASATCVVTVEAAVIPAESVELSEHELKLFEGATAELTAVVKPEDATSKAVVWSSSDAAVATVDQEGRVTAVAEGVAVIRVEIADDTTVYDECLVRVSKQATGIEDITGDSAPYEVYDLSGTRLGDSIKDLKPGFYIIRQGAKAMKLKL